MASRKMPKPLLQPFESEPPPKSYEVLDQSLGAFMAKHVPVESAAGLKARERVLTDLNREFTAWVKQVARAKGMSEKLAEECGGQMHTSGSYRLRVHEPGADIDSVHHPTTDFRRDFFETMKARLLENPRVENLRSIETAVVPIMTFDFDGINIDMLFATLPMNMVPAEVDIDDDDVLNGVDEATEKSLNGPRVTNLIYKFVEHNYASFLTVLRFARVWAKKRGIYSNKLGYLGGINFNILVALVCQLFPQATPAYLLTKFFHIFAKWNWPSPALLCAPVDLKIGGFEVWGAADDSVYGQRFHHGRGNLMPIVTPAYPAMNSAANVNAMTFGVIHDEFQRASELCKQVATTHHNAAVSLQDSMGRPAAVEALSQNWALLLQPSDFFERYDSYLAINVLGDGPVGQFEDWKGFFSSRLRKFVERLAHLPLSKIHLFPKEFQQGTAPGLAKHSASYFVGVVVDTLRLSGPLILTHIWSQFWLEDMVRFNNLDDELDVRLEHLQWKQLPEYVFPSKDHRDRLLADRQRARLLARQAAEAAEAPAAPAPEPAAAADDDAKRLRDGDVDDPVDDDGAKRPRSDEALIAVAEAMDAASDAAETAVVALEPAAPPPPPEPLTTRDLPRDLPRLGAVLPKWHPLAKGYAPPSAMTLTLLEPRAALGLLQADDQPAAESVLVAA